VAKVFIDEVEIGEAEVPTVMTMEAMMSTVMGLTMLMMMVGVMRALMRAIRPRGRG